MEGCLSSAHRSGRETGEPTLVGYPWLWDLPVSVDPGGRIPHVPQLRSGKAELSRSTPGPHDPAQTFVHASPANPRSAPGPPRPRPRLQHRGQRPRRQAQPPPDPGSPGIGWGPACSGGSPLPQRSRCPRLPYPTPRLLPLFPTLGPRARLPSRFPPCLCSAVLAKWERPSVRPRSNQDGDGTDSVSTRYRERCAGQDCQHSCSRSPAPAVDLPLPGQRHKVKRKMLKMP